MGMLINQAALNIEMFALYKGEVMDNLENDNKLTKFIEPIDFNSME